MDGRSSIWLSIIQLLPGTVCNIYKRVPSLGVIIYYWMICELRWAKKTEVWVYDQALAIMLLRKIWKSADDG